MKKTGMVMCIMMVILVGCFLKEVEPSYFQGQTMGSTYHIKVSPKLDTEKEKKLHDGIKLILEKVNKQMSTYMVDSEISKFNQLKKSETIKPSAEFYGVMMRAIDISRDTGGAFDITVGPLVNLWGFGSKSKRRDTPPSEEEIKETQQFTGMDLIEIDFVNESVGKRNDQLYIDVSAIAPGYAVDAVSNYLSENNYTNFMVEISGEIRVSGYKDIKNKKRWLIAVEKPYSGKRENGRTLPVTDISIATSGDYRNYFEYKGTRYSHIIDPTTGYPAKNNLASVTVLESDCVDADAYATALIVMGEEKGLDFVNEKKIKAIFNVRTQDSSKNEVFKEVLSKEMEKYLEKL